MSIGSEFIAATLPSPAKKPRQIFVAYSYRLYDRRDYRRPYDHVAKAFDVQFVFADEQITDLHILQKIMSYIRESQFGIYDISGWNANVTLELGLAFGLSERAFIAIDPSHTPTSEVPSDLQGIDRVQYASFSELQDKLEILLAQQLPVPRTHEAENQLDILRAQAIPLVSEGDGLKMGDIATALGISVDLAKVVIRPLLVDGTFITTGQRRGTRYYRAANEPAS